jgi:hypothetical protein
MKQTIELDTLLLIRLHRMSDEEFNSFFSLYNVKFEGKVWGL